MNEDTTTNPTTQTTNQNNTNDLVYDNSLNTWEEVYDGVYMGGIGHRIRQEYPTEPEAIYQVERRSLESIQVDPDYVRDVGVEHAVANELHRRIFIDEARNIPEDDTFTRQMLSYHDMMRRGMSAYGTSRVKEVINEPKRKEIDVSSKSRNKRLAEWSISARALKHLITTLLDRGEYPGSGELITVYKFGAMYNQRYRRWFIYNKGTNNNIATLKVSRNRAIIRYRRSSFYSPVLANYEADMDTIIVESSNLHRHSGIVRSSARYINNDENGQKEFRLIRKELNDRKHNR